MRKIFLFFLFVLFLVPGIEQASSINPGINPSAPPSGAAGGDLSGTYPNPSVIAVNGVGVSTATATAGNILVGDGTRWITKSVSGDGTLASSGALTISSLQGNSVTKTVCNVVMIGKYMGTNQSAAITRSGTTATYTLNAHGFSNGDWVQIKNATQTDYNKFVQISNVTTNTFDYTVANNPTTPSTGTSRVEFWFKGTRSLNLSLISDCTHTGTGNDTFTFTNTQTDAWFGIYGCATNSTSATSSALALFLNAGTGGPTTTTFSVVWRTGSGTATNADQYMALYLVGII